MSNCLVIVEKAKAQLSEQEEAALKMIAESKNFYRLNFTFEQVKKFWDWFNTEIRQIKQEPSTK
jgi:hypothetical protein